MNRDWVARPALALLQFSPLLAPTHSPRPRWDWNLSVQPILLREWLPVAGLQLLASPVVKVPHEQPAGRFYWSCSVRTPAKAETDPAGLSLSLPPERPPPPHAAHMGPARPDLREGRAEELAPALV